MIDAEIYGMMPKANTVKRDKATLPGELDDAYGISDSIAEWEAEQEEENLEIDLDDGLSATNEQEAKDE